jgi:histone H3/H4
MFWIRDSFWIFHKFDYKIPFKRYLLQPQTIVVTMASRLETEEEMEYASTSAGYEDYEESGGYDEENDVEDFQSATVDKEDDEDDDDDDEDDEGEAPEAAEDGGDDVEEEDEDDEEEEEVVAEGIVEEVEEDDDDDEEDEIVDEEEDDDDDGVGSVRSSNTDFADMASNASGKTDATPDTALASSTASGTTAAATAATTTPASKRTTTPKTGKSGGASGTSTGKRQGRTPSVSGLTIPFRTVKKAMKLDPDIPIVQNEAAIMTTIAVELFLKRLAKESYRNAKNRGRNTVRYEDVAEARTRNPALAFLEPLLP